MLNEPATKRDKNPIKVPSAANQVTDALRDLILRGELVAGDPIEEAPTAEDFGVSRNTVREAIRELVRAGLVTPRRLRPAVVVTLTDEDVDDIAFVRRLIELSAVRAIFDRGADVAPIESALEELLALQGVADWNRTVNADRAFHAAIVAASGSERLVRAFESIESEFRLSLSLTDRWDTSPEDQARQHQDIFDAIAQGRVNDATSLLTDHISDARERVQGVLAKKQTKADSE